MSAFFRAFGSWFGRRLVVGGFLCAAAFNLCLLAKGASYPAEDWWKKGHASLTVLVVLGVITAIYGTWLAFYRQTTERHRRRAEIAEDLEFLCRRAAADIDD